MFLSSSLIFPTFIIILFYFFSLPLFRAQTEYRLDSLFFFIAWKFKYIYINKQLLHRYILLIIFAIFFCNAHSLHSYFLLVRIKYFCQFFPPINVIVFTLLLLPRTTSDLAFFSTSVHFSSSSSVIFSDALASVVVFFFFGVEKVFFSLLFSQSKVIRLTLYFVFCLFYLICLIFIIYISFPLSLLCCANVTINL